MGLDMYLKKSEYVSTWTSDPERKTFMDATGVEVIVKRRFGKRKVLTDTFKVDNGSSGVEIKLPIAYWRKANAIHNWFVQNYADGVDDCKPIMVTMEDLVKLRQICKEILEDHSKAKKLLPTQGGFFFGSTDYDEWYYKDLEYTVDALKNLDKGDYEYKASW